MTETVRALGPAGAPPPSDLFYSTVQCVAPLDVPDGGALDVDAGLAAAHNAGGDASTTATNASGGDASTSSQGAGGHSGCEMAAGGGSQTRDLGGIGLLFAATLVSRRRRRVARA
jgi:MYXO-CTERM domain-containing protein